VPFENLGAVSYSPYTVTVGVSVAICEISGIKALCDLENKVRVCSRSLEMAPFDRPHTAFDRPTTHELLKYIIVTMTLSCIVCEISLVIG